MGEYKLKKNPIARVDLDGNITEIKETRKKPVARVDLSGKITDVKQPKKKKKGNFVQRGLSTAGDALISAGEGFLRTTENWADYISYKAADVADYFGWVSDEYADEWRDAIKKDIIGDAFDNKAFNAVKDESYMNKTARSVFEGTGNVLAMIGGGEVLGVSSEASSLSNAVRTGVASFTNGYGSSMSEALRNGVDYKTAKKAAIINGTAEAISEQVFNGIPGMKVENWGGKLTGKIGSQVEKYFGTKAGKLALKALDASGEGLEEIISNVLVSTGNDIAHFFDKNYNYGMENQTGNVLKDAWSSATSKESWNSFLSASLTSALVGGGNTILSNVQKNNIIKAYAEDNNMSVKEVKDMFKQSAQETADYLQKQQPKMNLGERVETEQQARDITLRQMKDNTFVKPGTETDTYQYQETDNEKVNNVRKSLAELNTNNTIETREMARTAERLARDLGIDIEFTNNEKLQSQMSEEQKKETQGRIVNGFVDKNTGKMYLNVDSDQIANFTIGHETKHFFEANKELNTVLNKALKEYAQLKGRYDEDLARITKTYTDKNGNLIADPETELMADYVGEFFTDYNFVSNLSTKNPSLFARARDFFQKLYYKATGQQEKLLLKQINDNINKAYREYSKGKIDQSAEKGGTQFLLSYANTAKLSEKQSERLNEAVKMKNNNATNEEIWNKTGVIFDGDTTKLYVNDFKLKDNIQDLQPNQELKLGDLFNSKIFENYPELKNYKFEIQDFEQEAIKDNMSQEEINELKNVKASAYDEGIVVNTNVKSNEELEKVLSHEVQHLIQKINGDNGDSYSVLKSEGIEAYRKLPTEIEAEVNRVLNGMTSEQRKNIDPQSIRDEILKYYKETKFKNTVNVDKIINRLVNKHGIQYSLSVKDVNPTEDSDIRYSLSEEYRGSHQIENAQSIINLDLNDIQNKVTEANGYLTKQDQNDLRKLKRILNNPNEKVKIYRASPVNELNSGDWITTDKSYAQNIANNNGGQVYTYEVNANQLYYPDNVNELPSLHRLSSFQYIKNEDTKFSLSQEGENLESYYQDLYPIKNKVTTRLNDLKRKEVELPTEQEKPLKLSKNEQKQVNNMNNEYLPLAVDKDVLKVEAADIANEINTTGDFDTTKKRSWIESLKSSDAIEDKSILNNLDFGKLNYQVQSNQKSLNKANDYIERNGYENSLNHVKDLIRSEKTPSAADVALMQRMTQEAIKNKDYQAAQELIMDTAILGTDLGQAVQALSIIQRLTPEGQLKLYTKIVNRAKIRGEKAFRDVQITPDMVETVLGAYNEDGTYDQNDLNSRVAQFKQNIAEQMKSTIGDKANAWRYLSMLGNPKTHIRNVISNVAMGWTTKVKNTMARTFETILPIKERTKTFVPASKEIRNFAKDTAIDMKGIITGENKYNEKVALEQEKRIFKSKVLEGVSRFNSAALEAEDWFFSRHAFEQNFREFLTARGIKTMEDVENNHDIVQQGKTYAVEQAEIATFRQYSKLASEISRIERNGKATKLALAAVLPFKKTPINVAKAGLKYSPLGLIKNVSYDAYQLSKGNINASQFIDNLSQGLTGTSIALVGYALAKAGILTGGSDDDKEDKYDSQLGKQNYAINIGGKSYSISWLSPTAMPLLVGANAYEKLEEEKDWSADILIDTLAKTLDPLSEMSFVSSLTDTLKSYNSGGIGMIKDMGETAAQSYILQFFPTLFGQMASTLDDTKRSTKASNNTGFKFGEETVRKIMLKIPGLRNQLEPQTDIWGNEKEQSGNIITRAVESFIAPYSKTEDITSDIDRELKRVYNQTGETGVIPGIPQAYVKKDDETYRMSASEYTQYKKTFGQIANQTMNELFNSDSYQDVSDEDKSKMIENVYKYAREQAKQEYFNSINEDFETKKSDKIDRVMEEYDITAGDYYANMEEFNYADKNPDRYLAIKQIADYKDYAGYKEEINYIKNTYSDKNERKRAVYEYINGLPLSVEQKIILQKVGANYSIKQYRSRLQSYINNLDLTRDEKIAIDKVLFK